VMETQEKCAALEKRSRAEQMKMRYALERITQERDRLVHEALKDAGLISEERKWKLVENASKLRTEKQEKEMHQELFRRELCIQHKAARWGLS